MKHTLTLPLVEGQAGRAFDKFASLFRRRAFNIRITLTIEAYGPAADLRV